MRYDYVFGSNYIPFRIQAGPLNNGLNLGPDIFFCRVMSRWNFKIKPPFYDIY